MKRLGLSGHSVGADKSRSSARKPRVQIVMPLAETHAVRMSWTLESALYVAGIVDKVLSYRAPATGIGMLLCPGTDSDTNTPSPGAPNGKKRLVGRETPQ